MHGGCSLTSFSNRHEWILEDLLQHRIAVDEEEIFSSKIAKNVHADACGRREVQVSLKRCLDQAQRQAGSEVKAEIRPQLRYSKDMTVMQRLRANLVNRP